MIVPIGVQLVANVAARVSNARMRNALCQHDVYGVNFYVRYFGVLHRAFAVTAADIEHERAGLDPLLDQFDF